MWVAGGGAAPLPTPATWTCVTLSRFPLLAPSVRWPSHVTQRALIMGTGRKHTEGGEREEGGGKRFLRDVDTAQTV